jgi:hypothetical protein
VSPPLSFRQEYASAWIDAPMSAGEQARERSAERRI